MKWNKITLLIISLIATSVVVFNNLIQLTEKLFLPKINKGMVVGFLIIMATIFIYTLINVKEIFK